MAHRRPPSDGCRLRRIAGCVRKETAQPHRSLLRRRLRRHGANRRSATDMGARRLDCREGNRVAGALGNGPGWQCHRLRICPATGGWGKPPDRRHPEQSPLGPPRQGIVQLRGQRSPRGSIRSGGDDSGRAEHHRRAHGRLLDFSDYVDLRRSAHQHDQPRRAAERSPAGYGRRELSTCSISFLTCWRSMNSR